MKPNISFVSILSASVLFMSPHVAADSGWGNAAITLDGISSLTDSSNGVGLSAHGKLFSVDNDGLLLEARGGLGLEQGFTSPSTNRGANVSGQARGAIGAATTDWSCMRGYLSATGEINGKLSNAFGASKTSDLFAKFGPEAGLICDGDWILGRLAIGHDMVGVKLHDLNNATSIRDTSARFDVTLPDDRVHANVDYTFNTGVFKAELRNKPIENNPLHIGVSVEGGLVTNSNKSLGFAGNERVLFHVGAGLGN
jgi:hypothetical protein